MLEQISSGSCFSCVTLLSQPASSSIFSGNMVSLPSYETTACTIQRSRVTGVSLIGVCRSAHGQLYPQCSMISALDRGSLQNAKIASWVVRAPSWVVRAPSWVVREPSWVVICNFCPVPRVPSTLRCCQTVQKKPVISTGKNCKHGALRRGLIPHWGPLQCLRIPIYVPWQGESTFFRKTRGPVVERWERLSFWNVSLWHEVPSLGVEGLKTWRN